MHYLGGKSRIASKIAAVMLAKTTSRRVYVEPFTGGGAVAAVMTPWFYEARLSDAMPDLIMLWKAVQDGWVPPTRITAAQYAELKDAPSSVIRGYTGFAASFGGKWFGGYTPPARGFSSGKSVRRNRVAAASRSMTRKAERIGKRATFTCADYRDLIIPDDAVVYCDPPYDGTTAYKGLPAFRSDEFWAWAEKLSGRCDVFVSEYKAPPGWKPVWHGRPQASLAKDDQTGHADEYLFRLRR